MVLVDYASLYGARIGYGILCATVVTLWLVPCLYLIGHDIRGYFNGLISVNR